MQTFSFSKDFNLNFIHSFQLFNQDFETFFKENKIIQKLYATEEPIESISNSNIVGYISRGFCKNYTINMQGDEFFSGFLPRHSIIYSTPGSVSLNKSILASSETEIIYCAISTYLEWLSQSNSRILHAIYEPYYRRNLNDLPRYETVKQSSKFKVYYYIYYLAVLFGKSVNQNSNMLTIVDPPSYKDIAYFYDIHPNNVVTFLSELKKLRILEKIDNKYTVLDMSLLIKELNTLKK